MVAVPVAIGLGVLKKFASQAIAQGAVGGQQAASISKEMFGYDFIGLLTKLTIFYVIAYLFAKFMEAIIYGGNFLNSFILGAGSLFGLKIPKKEVFPKVLVDLFIDGYGPQKIVYWDIVKALSLALVVFEGIQYFNANKKNGGDISPMTLGIFSLIIGGIGLVTIPELVNRNKPTLTLGKQLGDVLTPVNSGSLGDNIYIFATNFKPSTPVRYGWLDSNGLKLNDQVPSVGVDAQGKWLFDFTITQIETPGVYTIYVDQREFGGPHAETRFTVLSLSQTIGGV